MNNQSSFLKELNRARPMLIDGGLATQLEAQHCNLDHPLWSASVLQTNPDAIVKATRAYLDAGARCVSTASYQASYEGFAKLGLSPEQVESLMRLSVALARRARDQFLATDPDIDYLPLIAASIGPYGAMLHDGSEYTGHYGVGVETLREFHDARLSLFDKSDADLIALETIPSKLEAQVLAELLADCDKPAWVSFSCRDDRHISDGTPIAEVASLFRGHPTVVAVGVNCTPPQFVTALVRKIRAAVPDKAVIAYPNSGEVYCANDRTWSGTATPGDCATAALAWVQAGATIIGGCCRMGPEHIRAIRDALR